MSERFADRNTDETNEGAHQDAVNLKINGAAYDLQIEPRVSLLDALREFAGLRLCRKNFLVKKCL